MGLKTAKYMFNIRFVFDKINLGKMAKIIKKRHIIIISII
jgi:hypothetical protein